MHQEAPHSRLARLVVGPFWAWIWTGGGPSVHWKTNKLCNCSIITRIESKGYINEVNVQISRKGKTRWGNNWRLCTGKTSSYLLYVRWWGYAQGGCRPQCGPAAAAGRNSGASAQPRGHRCCFRGPCSSLQKITVGFQSFILKHQSTMRIPAGNVRGSRSSFWKANNEKWSTDLSTAPKTRAAQTYQGFCWLAAWQVQPCCCFPKGRNDNNIYTCKKHFNCCNNNNNHVLNKNTNALEFTSFPQI